MPRLVTVQNLARPIEQPARVKICASFLCRLRGLMFRRRLAAHEGLLLTLRRDARLDAAIHMLFVPFDLAVFWINSDMEIVDKVLARAWRLAYIPRRPARYVLEIHPQHLNDYDIGHKAQIRT